MQEPKRANFTDRLSAQAEAKKAMLAKFKPKPMVAAADFQTREERRQAELAAVRAAREAEKQSAREAQLAAQQAQHQTAAELEQLDLDAKRSERKERKAQLKAEAKAKREAKSAERRR
jgi:hypothetical protein